MLSISILALATPILYMATSDSVAANEAVAEDSDDKNVIVVTAQKRSQAITDVPIALSVFDSRQLEQRRISDISDALRKVPGTASANPSNELTQISIRGVSTSDYGISSDPAVGVFIDDIYLGRADNAAATFIDLDRIEVARGPQGALFGRATPGGAISLVSAKPKDETEFQGLAEVGLDAERRGYVIGNVPLSESLFLRGNIFYSNRGDYVTNLLTDDRLGAEERLSGRLSLLFDNGGPISLQLTGWAESYSGDPWLYRNFELTVADGIDAADPLNFSKTILSDASDGDLLDERDNWGGILRVEHDLDGYSILSLTSALGYEVDYLEDFDGSELFLFNYHHRGDQSLVTQEFRIVSPSENKFSWFAGMLSYREKLQSTYIQSYGDFDLCVYYEFGDETECAPAGAGVTDTLIFASARNKGFALYAEGSLEFMPGLTATVGGRYTRDTKKLVINAPVPGGFLPAEDVGYTIATNGQNVARSETFGSFQGRATLSWRASDQLSIYGAIANGEKPGGFDTFDAFSPSFDAEKVTSYELGAKASLLEGALNFGMAAYYYNYFDLQVLVADGPRDIVKNAAKADGKGLELEAIYSGINGARFDIRMAVTDAKYDQFFDGTNDFAEKRLTYTPSFSIGTSVELEKPLSANWNLYGRVDADYQSRQYFTPENALFASQDGYEQVDVRVGVRGRESDVEIYVFGQNMTGAAVAGYGNVTDYDANFGAYLAQFGRPSIFGLGLKFTN